MVPFDTQVVLSNANAGLLYLLAMTSLGGRKSGAGCSARPGSGPTMSADPSEGVHTNVLPSALAIEPGLVLPPIGPVGGVLQLMARDAEPGRPRKVLRIDREVRDGVRGSRRSAT